MRTPVKLVMILIALAIPSLAQPHPSVTLNWSWSQGTGDPATGFHVQRAAVAGGAYAVVGTVPVAVRTYLDVAVTAGATYFYVITAYNGVGDSGKSGEVACTLPFQVPSVPTGLSGTVK